VDRLLNTFRAECCFIRVSNHHVPVFAIDFDLSLACLQSRVNDGLLSRRPASLAERYTINNYDACSAILASEMVAFGVATDRIPSFISRTYRRSLNYRGQNRCGVP